MPHTIFNGTLFEVQSIHNGLLVSIRRISDGSTHVLHGLDAIDFQREINLGIIRGDDVCAEYINQTP